MVPHLNTDTSNDHHDDDIQPAPYTSGFVDASGLRLHYHDYGTAGRPPMLCVHGSGAHAHWFDFVAADFSTDYHVRALDQRGHGDSAWADPPAYSNERFALDLAEVVEQFDLRDFVLIGHSMGGLIALQYAATHPGRVARLIIVDTRLQMTEDRIGPMRNIGLRRGKTYATHEEFVARYRLRPDGTTASPRVIRHLAQFSGRQLAEGGWRNKLDRNVYATREPVHGVAWWKHIRVPALLMKGDRSPRITPQIFAEARALCPQLELAEIPNSDHHVTLDNPSEFTRTVKTFLARHA